jgi:hypothetical protein
MLYADYLSKLVAYIVLVRKLEAFCLTIGFGVAE